MTKEDMVITNSNLITNFSVRTAEKDGKIHLVIPIVALKEGVHCGSGGCAFYSATEINRTIQDWNGVPLTASHPKKNGELVLAKEALKDFKIGSFENTKYVAGKLKGEGWVDVERAEALSPKTLEMIRMGIPIEVSTSLLSHTDGNDGIWNGEKFEESLFDFVPDHLALLPEEEGACSLEDGCGVRMNTKKECISCKFNIKGGEKNVIVNETENQNVILDVTNNIDKTRNLTLNKTLLKKQGYWVNEISHSKVRENLSKLINEMDKPGSMHFLREIFDNHFIFEKNVENDSKLFSLKYSITKNDEVKIKGDPIEVTENITFPIKTNKEGIMSNNDVKKVKILIANEKLPFTEDDSKWLEELEENRFNRVFALNECGCDELEKGFKEATKKTQELIKANAELTAHLDTANKKEEEVGEAKPPTFEELLTNASPEMREAIQDGIKTNQEKRGKLVEILLANEKCPFTKEVLEGKKTDELEALVSFGAKEPVTNYSLKGPGGQKQYAKNERHPDGSGVPDMPDLVDTLQANYAARNKK